MTVSSQPPTLLPDFDEIVGKCGLVERWECAKNYGSTTYILDIALILPRADVTSSFEIRRDYWVQAEIIIERLTVHPGVLGVTNVAIDVKTAYNEYRGYLRVDLNVLRSANQTGLWAPLLRDARPEGPWISSILCSS